MGANIYDVAKIAEVSISTVSRVINNPDLVSKRNRDKVKNAMLELNYIPSAIARSLTNKITKTIGVVVADITNPYYAQILLSIQDSANELGYSIISCNSHEDMEKEKILITTLLEKKVDVVMFVGGRRIGNEYNNQLFELSKNTPVILCNEYIEYEDLYCVVCDKYKGAYDAVKYFISLNHKKIAFINGGEIFRPSQEKLNGYIDALKDSNIEVKEEYIENGNYHVESSYRCVERLFNLDNPPTAILASNDLMAMGAIKALKKLNLSVPADVSIIGFDDIFLNQYYIPEISSVSQKMKELGMVSVNIIPKVLNKTAEKRTIIKPELIIRETCKSL